MTAPTAVVDELASFLRPDAAGPMRDPAVGWPALLDLASAHGLLPALWSSLAARGVRPLPDELRNAASPLAVLERAYTENAIRVRRSTDQVVRVLDALEATDVRPVPIKGAHLLLRGWLRDPSARVMVDLDVLVRPERAAAAMAALEAYRYEALPFDPVDEGDHQLAPMVAPRWPASVELHLEPIIGFHRTLVTAAEVRAHAATAKSAGAARVLPSATDAIVLLIGHAQLQEEAFKLLRIPLRALHDLSNLEPQVLADTDWDRVTAAFGRAHGRIALAGFAVAAADLFAIDLPVPRRGGAEWWRATRWVTDHPSAARRYREAVSLPRALRATRMERLYGADGALGLAGARARHLGRGIRKRAAGITGD